jgi:hypothetical protein
MLLTSFLAFSSLVLGKKEHFLFSLTGRSFIMGGESARRNTVSSAHRRKSLQERRVYPPFLDKSTAIKERVARRQGSP